MEMSFIPKASSGRGVDDMLSADYQPSLDKDKSGGKRDKKVERFGAGLEKGGYTGRAGGEREISEAERKGRASRRHPGRSASKNVFRGM
jgi:ribosome biogenesis protein ENP2